ncbi:replication initiation factor domain-containing protein [Leptospira weilii]|uniref:Replication initiation factor n=1 Tax=Leptospira weilii str. UI 13098 TaxID=1088542 RepID=M6QNV1_9LEPT|nr:replication initiation factor domain-containing protein [Leptospira weilii]EMN90522.1 replication initiation factor [Leptospira weilii str. UI 13098]
MTSNNPLEILENQYPIPEYLKNPFVDWLSFSIEYSDDAWDWLHAVFGELKIEEKGTTTGHTHQFRTSADVFGAFSPERRSQKIYISLSSKALFNFGASKETLTTLIQGAIKLQGRFTRIDLAQDDYEGKLNLPFIYEKLQRKEVATRFRGYSKYEAPFDLVTSGSLFKDPKLGKLGYTIYVGAFRGSNVFVRIYDKKLQTGQECAWPIWNRVEFQLNHDAADQYCNPSWNVVPETGEILNTSEKFPDPRRAKFEDRSFPKTAYYYLKFLDPTYKQKTNELGHLYLEQNGKQMWIPCNWWTDFLKTSEREPIGLPRNETGLQDIDNWLKNQVSGAVFLMADLYGDKYFSELKAEGKDRFERNKKYQRLKEQFKEKKQNKMKEEIPDEVGF